jgi:hypothetical protein
MKTKIIHVLVPTLFFAATGTGQTFRNLDFDAANTNGDTVASALPGWNASVGGYLFSAAFYNTVPLDGSYVGVFDRNAPSYMPKPLLNRGFGAMLAAGYGGDVSLVQTGQLPMGSSSVSFWTTGPTGATGSQHDDMVGFAVNGQNLALNYLGGAQGWSRWGADISAFSGTTAELRFSLHSYYGLGSIGAYEMYLDNIAITSIPEPRAIPFVGGLALLLAFRRGRLFSGAVADGAEHRFHVLDRGVALDVVDGVKDETAVAIEDVDAFANLGMNLVRRPKGDGLLGVHAAAPEHEVLAELALEPDRVHFCR